MNDLEGHSRSSKFPLFGGPYITSCSNNDSIMYRLTCLVLLLRNVLNSSKKVSLSLYLRSPVIAIIDILCDLTCVRIVLRMFVFACNVVKL